jgi:arabinofuranosyltransferase
LGVAAAWLLAQRLLPADGRTLRRYSLFSGVCLIVGLIRPEGVLMAVFMLAAVGVLIPRRDFLHLAVVFGSVFLLLGGAYFLWRWFYFGHPFPNPYYMKGGGQLYLDSLKASVRYSLLLGLPFIPFFLLAVRSNESLRKAAAFLIPIVGATGMWVLLSNEMNFGARFQYPILSLYALSWYPLTSGLARDLHLPRWTTLTTMQQASLVLVATLILGFTFQRHLSASRTITYYRDGRFDIGIILSQYADRGYTIATTEAGLLPLYSEWRAIDTWGLNDRWIAQNRGVTYEYLAQQQPDMIVWHEYFSPLHPPSAARAGNPWFRQVMTLKQYAEQNDFTLAAVFGTRPYDTHYYYVRSDLPEHDAIVQGIKSTDYHWFSDGRICTNYAEVSEE